MILKITYLETDWILVESITVGSKGFHIHYDCNYFKIIPMYDGLECKQIDP